MVKWSDLAVKFSLFHCSNAIPVSICMKKLASFDLLIFDPKSGKYVSRYVFVRIHTSIL